MLNRVKCRLTVDSLDCLPNFKVTSMNASWYYETLEKSKEEYPLALFIAAKERLGLATLREKLRQLTINN